MKTFTFRYDPKTSLSGMFDEFKKAVKHGASRPRSNELTASSVAALLTAMTAVRIELFYAIAKQKPESVYQLAKFLGRDPANVLREVKALEGMGLITLKTFKGEGREKLKPVANYDRVVFDFGQARSTGPIKTPKDAA